MYARSSYVYYLQTSRYPMIILDDDLPTIHLIWTSKYSLTLYSLICKIFSPFIQKQQSKNNIIKWNKRNTQSDSYNHYELCIRHHCCLTSSVNERLSAGFRIYLWDSTYPIVSKNHQRKFFKNNCHPKNNLSCTHAFWDLFIIIFHDYYTNYSLMYPHPRRTNLSSTTGTAKCALMLRSIIDTPIHGRISL